MHSGSHVGLLATNRSGKLPFGLHPVENLPNPGFDIRILFKNALAALCPMGQLNGNEFAQLIGNPASRQRDYDALSHLSFFVPIAFHQLQDWLLACFLFPEKHPNLLRSFISMNKTLRGKRNDPRKSFLSSGTTQRRKEFTPYPSRGYKNDLQVSGKVEKLQLIAYRHVAKYFQKRAFFYSAEVRLAYMLEHSRHENLTIHKKKMNRCTKSSVCI